MEMLFVLLLGLSILLGSSAVNPVLDPTDAAYGCEVNNGILILAGDGIADEDMDDLATCLDAVGRDNIRDLWLYSNDFTTLPASIFKGLTALERLWLYLNDLTALPEGVFDGLEALEILWLEDNALTTLPEGLFDDLKALTNLNLEGNNLECLPIVPSTLVELESDDPTWYADGLHVDPYGEECGCSILGVTNVCGENICTPGPVGYTCEPATPAPTATPTPEPTPETTPDFTPEPTPEPIPESTPVLTTPPTAHTTTPAPASLSAIVGGVVGGVVVVGTLVLVGLFKTGRMKMVKRGQSPGPNAAASGAASYPVARQYPTIPQGPAGAQYPSKPRYPEPI